MESNRHSREGGNPVSALITDNIDIWTSAIQKRNATGRGSSKKVELTGIKKLRELILELAVRGKLVPQDPNDEPASVLLEKIAQEKAQLIKDKVIKKTKALPEITDNEKPFELPNGWEWVRLQTIIQISSGNGLTSRKMNLEGEIPVYGGNGVTGHHDTPNVNKPTLVIGRVGFYCGSIHITPELAWVTDNAFITRFSEQNIDIDYLSWLLKATDLNENDNATAQPVISGRKLYPIVVCLPPLAEQHRIVAKVDELMALCDQLEQQTEQSLSAHQTLVEALLATLVNGNSSASARSHALRGSGKLDIPTQELGNELKKEASADDFASNWQRIANYFDVLFTTEASIEQLKQTILQLAVMGKLVPQNPNDEAASVLLEKIAAEKTQLIKDKKIKKQKSLPQITDEEKPFELPSGWEWCRFENIAKNEKNALKAGPFGSALKKSMYVESGYKIYGQEQVISGDENIGDYFVDTEKYFSLESCKVQPDDILISLVGTIGKVLILSDSCSKGIINPRLVKLSLNSSICKRYIQLMLGSQLIQDELFEKSHGSTMNVLNLGLLKKLIFPLPKIAEQHRIVAKVDELMALCDQLKARLSDAQTTQVHLADAVVTNALNNRALSEQ